ncbi:ammonia-forming cytochrome c nitrite reductase subunit c552 [Geomonas sp. RF6]|uniref:ammonia-forming cytochrome c nitrite reductase subunit c552 n=1 Tax=Geomonas sp. RF6 TaxID=2897342 RepID=UPI001E656DBF|nr:ammonia-forming cytochrome c nitrite reductase subunit c552 [Geomonas sp. RF6]UFS72084.1 ammonia-forming cytochrome c nitrite reductase subunit c552 [Geomonas sp. RF6]
MLKRKVLVAATLAAGALAAMSLPSLTTAAKTKPAPKMVNDGRAKCYECHEEVKALKEGSKHAKLSCKTCHDRIDEHLKDSSTVPGTRVDHEVCGKCHKSQYDSFFEVHYDPSGARKDKGMPGGRSPMQDKLLAGHGFTFEHTEPRGHAHMVVDQFASDRFQGGRYQFKGGWANYDKTGKTWDILEDKGAGTKLPETAMAGNPTCMQCKSSDLILKWKFMGEKGGKFDRTSNVNDVAKEVQNPLGCIFCHDPHGTQPRVIRDALIQGVQQNAGGNIFSKGGKTDLKAVDFRGFRKIGIMEKTDSRMMCAQCHVEYNCNAGTQWSDGKAVKGDDPRTNHFPLKSAKDLLEHYKKLDFYDFKHAVTGARLVKLQHPEAETYAGSVHDKAGVQCHQCHMPKQKGKDGKIFSSHSVVRPAHAVQEACLGCHPKDGAAKKKYQIETIRNYTKGKMRKAEYWLGSLIDTYAAAQRLGVAETVLAQAREKHEEAHVLWEYWTAENSDGFHNPQLARESLTASISASKAGVKILNDAMLAKKDEKK